MKPSFIVALFLCALLSFSCKAPETFKDDLDFTIAEVEYNYVGYSMLTDSELAQYDSMKVAVRDSVDAGVYSDFDGVGHYLAWFQQRHLRTCWDAHNHLWKESVDYAACFPYYTRCSRPTA